MDRNCIDQIIFINNYCTFIAILFINVRLDKFLKNKQKNLFLTQKVLLNKELYVTETFFKKLSTFRGFVFGLFFLHWFDKKSWLIQQILLACEKKTNRRKCVDNLKKKRLFFYYYCYKIYIKYVYYLFGSCDNSNDDILSLYLKT